MSWKAYPLHWKGRAVGQAVSVLDKFVFYSPERSLSAIDGARFDSLNDARIEIGRLMERRGALP